ncbi:UDP-N-acetylmuramoyl-L-alanine--D-glutamate ligase [Variovorax sp. RTB1]|uniref:UDP-N-acetylmuramoyl-L-alanine--D-glutamate ligase n=1 Tax=Variovorax sp. RTB1 TaxID=3048631 RepID=UPI002B22D691|nr:UDP-N-acetylmuramoyl-L-alanine--D-glutamate ligase [Variovorax sp. RTB1]MEB0110331.1 UDP-N-acetylmuramoyl-L-alanine--D-glutamate ligase [Variovorax sp. RTB1]
MKHLQDLHVLVLGLGASGLAIARWCARHGAHVTVADTREAPPQLATLQQDVPGATFVGGAFTAALVEGTPVRAVYRSPGLSPEAIAPVADAARAIGLPVAGELDLFAQALADLRIAPDVPEVPEVPVEEAVAEPTPVEPEAEAGEQTDDDVEADLEVAVALAEDDEEAAVAPLPVIVPPEALKGYTPAVLAVTGTNGKTTVTALTGQLVERAGKTVAVAGNIGPTLLDTLAAHMDADTLPQVWVLELSSFQLDGVQGFEPTAAVVLNVTQDHLDWHGDMVAYAAAKARVFGARGPMILNRDDATVMAMLPPPVRAKLQRPQVRAHVTFGGTMPLRPGDYGIEQINGMGWLVRALEADETQKRKRGAAVEEEIFMQRLMPANALRIRGQHNALNALAALALATAAGCQLAPMLYGLREYRGEPHRVESIATVDEVEYFDDSKGTNVGATVAALNGLGAERKLVVILGGEGKGQDFSPLAEPVRNFARAVVLIGHDAPLITEALASTNVPLVQAASMDEAVLLAARSARPSDAVLLSPACASFDMFRDYGHRAAVFRDAVQALADMPRETSGAPA